jgi:hypothetical protein
MDRVKQEEAPTEMAKNEKQWLIYCMSESVWRRVKVSSLRFVVECAAQRQCEAPGGTLHETDP